MPSPFLNQAGIIACGIPVVGGAGVGGWLGGAGCRGGGSPTQPHLACLCSCAFGEQKPSWPTCPAPRSLQRMRRRSANRSRVRALRRCGSNGGFCCLRGVGVLVLKGLAWNAVGRDGGPAKIETLGGRSPWR
ncbi:hypothetical protein DQ04_05231000 [Trypanosoma grayi]|uniref:hypothetical protein n=1 Tax=Trypanosoma grayi TaxID=71804 RepID=UPI0004F45076|nr:hypothetical protein DQ04_05231000 [Trypanosoma grayi]KEG09430.1 hypothetical protein DQ04_05231000 [Trypanosoma grayi]